MRTSHKAARRRRRHRKTGNARRTATSHGTNETFDRRRGERVRRCHGRQVRQPAAHRPRVVAALSSQAVVDADVIPGGVDADVSADGVQGPNHRPLALAVADQCIADAGADPTNPLQRAAIARHVLHTTSGSCPPTRSAATSPTSASGSPSIPRS